MFNKKLLSTTLFVALLLLVSSGCSFYRDRVLKYYNDQTFHVGLKTVDFEYDYKDGKKEKITTAIWYPTTKKPDLHKYNWHPKSYKSRIAKDALVAERSNSFPLIIFSHGGFGSGYDSAFLMEYLASNGYIAAALDYVDTEPPYDKNLKSSGKQIAFSRIKHGNVKRTRHVIKILKQFKEYMKENEADYLAYLNRHRFNQTSFIIDRMLGLNKDVNSIFHQAIDEDAIGVCGHSQGGLTLLGKIGGHPDKSFKDDRIKATLLLASAIYPIENTLNNISVPLMLMVGDRDLTQKLTKNTKKVAVRRTIYDKVSPPKYFLVLENARHVSFTNLICRRSLLYLATKTDKKTNTICRYSTAFFDKYLKNGNTNDELLNKPDKPLVYYIKEEKPGNMFEWGKEPVIKNKN